MAGDVVREPLVATDGRMALREVGADPELLERYAASTERRDWWHGRLRRCYAVLSGA